MAESQKQLSTAVSGSIQKALDDITAKQRAQAQRKLAEWVIIAAMGLFFLAGCLSLWMFDIGRDVGYKSGIEAAYAEAREKEDAAGYARGRVAGYEAAKSEKAAAAWANTPEGRFALSLAKSGTLQQLGRCTGKGWKVENGNCYPYSAPEGVYGWPMLEDAPTPKK